MHASASQGMEAPSAKSTLNAPGPYRYRSQPAHVPVRETRARDAGRLARGYVEHEDARGWELVERFDPPARDDLAAQGAELGSERVCDGLGAAAGEGPPDGMRRGAQEEPDRGGERLLQRQHRMRRQPREESAGRLVPERTLRETAGGARRSQPEAGEGQRMTGHTQQRAQQLRRQPVPVAHQRRHQPAVGGPVRPERGRGRVERAVEYGRRPAVQGVGERQLRVDPRQAVPLQRQGAEERRADGQRVDRRTDVMHEARQRQFLRARAAADGVLRLEHGHGAPGAGQGDRGAEAVGARTDHHCVVRRHRSVPLLR